MEALKKLLQIETYKVDLEKDIGIVWSVIKDSSTLLGLLTQNIGLEELVVEESPGKTFLEYISKEDAHKSYFKKYEVTSANDEMFRIKFIETEYRQNKKFETYFHIISVVELAEENMSQIILSRYPSLKNEDVWNLIYLIIGFSFLVGLIFVLVQDNFIASVTLMVCFILSIFNSEKHTEEFYKTKKINSLKEYINSYSPEEVKVVENMESISETEAKEKVDPNLENENAELPMEKI
eukprot:snap_masked-scaffold_2-processed-gene-21.29-mRNA-1 protein AED:0.31 eAED:1.00 QI:0/0/0/1/1/1/2/0/236